MLVCIIMESIGIRIYKMKYTIPLYLFYPAPSHVRTRHTPRGRVSVHSGGYGAMQRHDKAQKGARFKSHVLQVFYKVLFGAAIRESPNEPC